MCNVSWMGFIVIIGSCTPTRRTPMEMPISKGVGLTGRPHATRDHDKCCVSPFRDYLELQQDPHTYLASSFALLWLGVDAASHKRA